MNAFDLEKPESCSTDCPCHVIETTIGLIAESIYVELGVGLGQKIEKELVTHEDFHLDSEYYTESDHNELIRLLIYGKLRLAIREIVESLVSEFNLEPWNYWQFSEELHSKFRLNELVAKLDKTLSTMIDYKGDNNE